MPLRWVIGCELRSPPDARTPGPLQPLPVDDGLFLDGVTITLGAHSTVLVFADDQVSVVVSGRIWWWWPRLDGALGLYQTAEGDELVRLGGPPGLHGVLVRPVRHGARVPRVARGDEGEDSVVDGETISPITDHPVARASCGSMMTSWSTRRPASSRARLLAHLYLKGLVRQPEVAVTEAITWLCALPGGSHALDQLIRDAGLDPGPAVAWYAEVPAADGSRTDIEAWRGDPPLPRVVIEAKLGHTLTVGQLAPYVADLKTRLAEHDGSDDGVVVVLVPEVKQQWPAAYTDAAGHVWVPLEVPVGVSGSGMIARVAEGKGSDRGDSGRTKPIGYGIRSA